jgi:hypothetical protein
VNWDVCITSAIFEFRVYVLSHAFIEQLYIVYETLTQYQRELDAEQLTKDILLKKLDNIVAVRKQRNYNKSERLYLYKSS